MNYFRSKFIIVTWHFKVTVIYLSGEGSARLKQLEEKRYFFKMSSSGNISKWAPHYLFYFTTAFVSFINKDFT